MSASTPRRRSSLAVVASTAIAAGLSLTACKKDEPSKDKPSAEAKAPLPEVPKLPAVSAAQVLERAKPIFGVLPEEAVSATNPLTPEKIELGRMLYYDARFSRGQNISCNTCHDLDKYGIDPREKDGKFPVVSVGHKDQTGTRNSPTVYNAAIHLAQFWDGRAADVEEQAKGPIVNPVEMAMADEMAVLALLKSIPGYVERFKAVFPEDKDPITFTNYGKAVGAFERKLMTPAPFDEFLEGNMGALSQKQLAGLQLFMDAGCITCHTGPAVGGTMFQKLGSVKPYPTKDLGRFEVTKLETDKFMFKVPSLRNVAKTAPYLHDGSLETLPEVVKMMVEYQTAKGSVTDLELDALLAFLDSLTGTIPSEYIKPPELPPNGPNTPGPDPN